MALENLLAMVNTREESEEQASSSSNTTSSSDYHTVQSSGNSPTHTRAPTSSSSSVYYSTRIQRMIENRSNFSSETEFDIEYSREHWSELTGSDTDSALTRLANREHFEVLKKHPEWGGFFKDVKVKLGEKINEGGQAEIYDAEVEFEDGSKSPYGIHVVKVMKGDCPLQDFQRQWPVGMLCNASKDRVKGPLMWIKGGTLVDNRFAFVMLRQWGDLRKLIDTRMQLNRNQGPPFQDVGFVKKVMLCIARDMDALHSKYGIVHRDLKASNVLLWSFGEELPDDNPHVKANVVDYECSVGVLGTGYWRAPEVLQQLKDRISSSEIVFTFMSDVYSYGMTCYELLTGRTPFEGHFARDYDLVLSGNRPNLSQFYFRIDYLILEIIMGCWNHEPLERPTFSEIVKMLSCKDEELQVSKLEQEKAGIVSSLTIVERTEEGILHSFLRLSEYIEDEFSRMFPIHDLIRFRFRHELGRRLYFLGFPSASEAYFESMYKGLLEIKKGAVVSMLERRQARTEEELRIRKHIPLILAWYRLNSGKQYGKSS